MGIKYKLFVWFVMLISLMTLVFSSTSHLAQKRAFLRGIDEKLLVAVRLARALVPEDYHDRIQDKNSVSPSEFTRIVARNNQACQDLDIQYLWSCLRLGNQVVFTTATSTSKDVRQADHASFLEAHQDPHAFDAAFDSMQPVYSTFHNQWGEGRMLLVPATDRQGRVYCFGASVKLAAIRAAIHQSLVHLLLVAAGLSLVGLMLSLYLSQAMVKPILVLADTVKRVSAGNDYTIRAPNHSSDEIGFLSDKFNQMLAQIESHQAELRSSEEGLRKLSLQLSHAEVEARRRMARELHDSTGQKLTALAMMVGLLQDTLDAPDKREKLFTDCQTLIEQCTQEIRTSAYLLHPPLLDELGLAVAINAYVEGFAKRSGVAVAFEEPTDLGRLPSEVEITLFRIVQECLGNIYRHAGTSAAGIRLACDVEQVVLEVSDQGRGMSAETLRTLETGRGGAGVGIAGMKERLRLLSGRLEIESGGKGTTMRAIIPRPEVIP
jgi:signal transduction histidine kinase/heme exporter protein D